MVLLSMTLSDPEPQFQGHSSLKANISQTERPIYYIFGSRLVFSGAHGAISGSLDGCAVACNPCVSWAFSYYRDLGYSMGLGTCSLN